MKESKFKKGDTVWWTDPSDGFPKRVRINKCDPYTSPEPFYTIKILKDFGLTHSFESNLRSLEEGSDSEQ
ncbi:MAG: hypothetical protein ACW96N_00075 [Candidatus Thorarchaeota archaeon]|jgi:hypothetical protein